MILRDLLDSVNKEKREKNRLKVIRKFALGVGVIATAGVATGILFAPKSGKEMRDDLKKKAVGTIETIKATARKEVEMVKDSANCAAKEGCDVMKGVNGKAECVKKDIMEG